MNPKSVLDLEVAAALKSARTAIRLKHSLACDAELNDVLPEIAEAMNAAAVTGKPFRLDIAALVATA